MTSGKFKTISPDKIWVDRNKRQRREIKNIDELAESISRVGLIHPPVIRESGELVVGERRWNAVKQLGWTSIPVQYIEELSEEELRAVELEENIRREDISWQDNCLSVDEYHGLRLSKDKSWNIQKTADALGASHAEVSQKLAVAKELKGGNVRVAEADKYSKARTIVYRETERKRAAAVDDLLGKPSNGAPVPILNEDFHEWAKTYDGRPFNFVHCDFPYGVNADKHDQGAADTQGGYEDSYENYLGLLGTLRTATERKVVSDNAHLIFWFSMDYYGATKSALELSGWFVDPFPLIWFKSDNTGIIPDPLRGPRRIYETAFFCRRGDLKIVTPVANCYPAPVIKEHHMSEKNLMMLQHFMRMIVDEHSTVLDPTAGSGNALIAAKRLGAGNVLGLEKDKEFHERAIENWRSNFGA